MSQVTIDGFQADDLATIYQNLQTAMQTIFGNDIDLDPDTLDGQTIGIYAESKADSDQLALDVYNSWNPQTATGVALSRIVEFNGIRRIPSVPSQGTVTCSGNVGTFIPIGSLVACELNNEQFITIQDAYIQPNGEVDISVLSQNYGAIQAPVGTITKIMTPVFGWQRVTNNESVILGRNLETDEELRVRRSASTATPAQAVPESVYGAVANIPQVTQVRLYENKTGQVDPETGLPPHSFSVIVQGGADDAIAAAIWNRASIGAEQVGDTLVILYDVQGFPHDIRFQRPIPVRVHVYIELKTLTGWGDSIIAEMQQNISEWTVENWRIGTSIIRSRLYEPINDFPNVFSVKLLAVDLADPATGTTDINIPYDCIAQLAPDDIIITKVA